MSFTDAISRVAEIQHQIAALTTPVSASSPTSTQFAAALAQAQGSEDTSVTDASPDDTATSSPAQTAAMAGSALPASTSAQLTSGQQQFASTLVADTGLNPSVVSAWMLAEENGAAAQSRQSADNNDWLNVGYTGSGTAGTAGTTDAVWSDPVSAANATAGWLKGESSIPGYGTASRGVQSILSSVGQSPSAQITALQSSGWASSGYPDLPSLYSELSA